MIFKMVLTKYFSQNVSDLILKISMPLVIDNPFMCLLWIDFFFSILEKVQSRCLIGASQLSKYCLDKVISKPFDICIIRQRKCHSWWNTLEFVTGNVTNAYYIKRKLAISKQIFAVSEVSGNSYCNRNANSGTKTYAANLNFIWQPLTTSNSQEFTNFFVSLQVIKSCVLHTIQW